MSPKFSDAEIETQKVGFPVNGKTAAGYLARPKASGPFAALVICHEWWGLNEHIQDIARRFAREGFAALAVDVYDGRVTRDPGQASQWMTALKPEEGLKTLNAAVEYLKKQTFVVASRLGATGFCMGGSFALLLACHNRDIRAAVPFYGDVPDPDDPIKNLNCPLMFIGAEKDQWITLEKMGRLKNAIQKYGKKGEVKIYPNVEHAFFNDTRKEVYNADAARNAWQQTISFLNKHLSA